MLETIDVNISNLMSWYYSHRQRSAGKEIEFQGKHIQFKNLQKKQQVKKFDYVLMSAGGGTSKQFAPIFEKLSNCY